MAMNAYGIRYAVLTDARQMLMDQWMRTIELDQGPNPPAPTIEEIKALATEMYDFVKTKD